MTPNELESLVRKLDLRVTRIEQILPTLVTKDDLTTAEARFEARLTDRIDALSRQMLVLHEDLKSDIRLLAEHLARVIERLDRGR